MRAFVAQVSSLYPIDLAAALVCGIADPAAGFRIFLNDVAELPEDTEKRFHVARSALPLFKWSFSSKGLWQQHHLPLDQSSSEDAEALLSTVAESLTVKDDPEEKTIRTRATELALSAAKRAQSSRTQWGRMWGPLAAGIIEEIFEQVLGAQVKVEPYWPCRLGAYGDHFQFRDLANAALARLVVAAREAHPRVLSFLGGGHVEVFDPSSSSWRRFSGLGVEDNKILLLPSDDSERPLWTSLRDLNSVRFRGPLEMMQLQACGLLVDLPSYATANMQSSPFESMTGVEWISPMAVRSKSRSSEMWEGGGMRLYPTGYSLVEFRSAQTRSVIGKLLKTRVPSEDDLNDWRRLVYDCPPAGQKISKHQQSMGAYRAVQEAASRKRTLGGDLQGCSRLISGFTLTSPFLYGSLLLEFINILQLLKEWSVPSCPHRPSGDILSMLQLVGWVQNDATVPARIRMSTLEYAGVLNRWLTSYGWVDRQGILDQIAHGLEVLTSSGTRALFGKVNPDPGGLGIVLKSLRQLLDQYLEFAAFCCGALLKAQILHPFLTLGPEQYRAELGDLLVHRKTIDRLYFDPQLWSDGS